MPFQKGNQLGSRKGRPRGARNILTEDAKALALPYSADAMATLGTIMRNVEMPPQARVAAANGLLDRAFGRPAQALTGADGGAIAVQTIVEHHHESS